MSDARVVDLPHGGLARLPSGTAPTPRVLAALARLERIALTAYGRGAVPSPATPPTGPTP
ncbi:MAG: hypothetical protein JWM27_4714 [Gemmatimonadetes bacterium]|nr:hypothetical protein [Gemmatimonadota bacterium]